MSNYQATSTCQQLSLFDQPAIRAKMLRFHFDIALVDWTRCSTCSEAFPGMALPMIKFCINNKNVVYSASVI